MTLPTWLEPTNARITIPIVLVIGYAIYHWVRWLVAHPKEDEGILPVKNGEAKQREVAAGGEGQVAEKSPAPTPEPQAATTVSPEAERLWNEARGLIHSEAADISTDWRYMNLLYQAAELGHLMAISKLGDHAFLRGDMVEAFYWKLRVELTGGLCRNPSLNEIITTWLEDGCPEGLDCVKSGFSAEQVNFAHAVLCYKCNVNPQAARILLNRLADAGNADARRWLRRK